MHFDFLDLRLFVHIAQENSLTKAASRLHLSVPAASIRIKKLEASLGVQLLNRVSQGITLTPPGQAFLHRAQLVLQELADLQGELEEYTGGVTGHVRVLANTTAVTEYLPKALQAFRASHPNVVVDLREKVSHDIVRLISDGLADVGISGNIRTEGLKVIPYRKDRLVIATAADHPLAAHSVVPFRDTLRFDFIGLHENSWLHSFLKHAASDTKVPMKIRIHVSNFEAVCSMIEAGMGIGILPESAGRRLGRNMNISLVQLSDEWAERKLVICVRKVQALSPFVGEFVKTLVETQ